MWRRRWGGRHACIDRELFRYFEAQNAVDAIIVLVYQGVRVVDFRMITKMKFGLGVCDTHGGLIIKWVEEQRPDRLRQSDRLKISPKSYSVWKGAGNTIGGYVRNVIFLPAFREGRTVRPDL